MADIINEETRGQDLNRIKIPIGTLRRLSHFTTEHIQASGERKSAIDWIPEGGVLIDIGCGNGDMGIAVAQKKKCQLIQADILDKRQISFKTNHFVLIDSDSPPNFTNFKTPADTAIAADVLDKVGYPDQDPAQAKISFLKGILTGLKPDGKIIVVSTRQANKDSLSKLKIEDLVETDPDLLNRVIFYPSKHNDAGKLIKISESFDR